jgi:succinylglutamate desuccinylase
MKNSVSWNITPWSPVKVNRLFAGKRHLHFQGYLLRGDFLLTYLSFLKMEATYSSEISVDFHRATRRYIPENTTLHSHSFKILKYKILYQYLSDFIL